MDENEIIAAAQELLGNKPEPTVKELLIEKLREQDKNLSTNKHPSIGLNVPKKQLAILKKYGASKDFVLINYLDQKGVYHLPAPYKIVQGNIVKINGIPHEFDPRAVKRYYTNKQYFPVYMIREIDRRPISSIAYDVEANDQRSSDAFIIKAALSSQDDKPIKPINKWLIIILGVVVVGGIIASVIFGGGGGDPAPIIDAGVQTLNNATNTANAIGTIIP
jgi:hypothetical protein